MSDLNSFTCTGNLVQDPELRYTAKGTAVCNFTLAINRGFGDSKTVSFIGFTAWAKTAENMRDYLAKGSKISVRGYLSQERWGEEGNKKSKTKVVADEVNFISGRKKPPAPSGRDQAAGVPVPEPTPDPDTSNSVDIPF